MTGRGPAEAFGPRPVVVAMLTYRRPADLAEAVPAVLEQLPDVGAVASLLVVDNDPAGTGAPVVEPYLDRGVRYVREGSPGIAAARNRALDEVDDATLLVFIDDDERPRPGWLRSLVATHAAHHGSAVVGPVVSEYEGELEPWIAAGRFFDRRQLATGTLTDVAATNNLLLDMAVVRGAGLRFDERFGQSGGSDTLFTRQLASAGPLVWCAEAVVVDRVPAARMTRSWVLARAYRSGNSWVRTSLVLAPSPVGRGRVRVEASARGALRVGGGVARFALGVATRSRGRQARGRRTVARGLGMIAGAYGHVREEYRRDAPTSPAVASAAGVPVGQSRPEAPADGKRIGVVVVNYGAHAMLPRALDELTGTTDVVVVDNFSSDAERVSVTELCRVRGWTLLARDANDGFGTAANEGVREVTRRGCDVVVILNPDARIGAEDCTRLATLARTNPRSLISPRIIRPDGSEWFRGSTVAPESGHLSAVHDEFVSAEGSWLTGACLTSSTEWWRDLGGFSDEYFLYWEDIDLSTRCIRAGGTLILADVTAEHAVGGTQPSAGRAKSTVYYRYNCRNRLLYAARLLPAGQLWSWLLRTPAESTAILLRGGRRQLITSPAVGWAALLGSVAGIGLAVGELIIRAAGRGRIESWAGRSAVSSTGSAGARSAVRVYGNLRTAHLERLREMEPAAVIHTRSRYDFDPSVAPAGQSVQKMSRARVVAHLLRTAYDIVEVNEPLSAPRWWDLLAQIAAVRCRGLFDGRRSLVVAYCIGHSDPAGELLARRPWVPSSIARVSTKVIVRVLVGLTDRLAFGTEGSRELYESYVSKATLDRRAATFEGLPAACRCPMPPRGAPVLQDSPGRLIFVGAFDRRKGIEQLMAAWDAARASGDRSTLQLLGKGALTAVVTEWAATRAEVEVIIDPPRDAIHRALRSADVLVLLSQPVAQWREQIGLPILEGLSHGLRIVASDQTGLAGWLRAHGHTVLPADAGPGETADALRAALADNRPKESVLADLPETDRRIAADRWLMRGDHAA